MVWEVFFSLCPFGGCPFCKLTHLEENKSHFCTHNWTWPFDFTQPLDNGQRYFAISIHDMTHVQRYSMQLRQCNCDNKIHFRVRVIINAKSTIFKKWFMFLCVRIYLLQLYMRRKTSLKAFHLSTGTKFYWYFFHDIIPCDGVLHFLPGIVQTRPSWTNCDICCCCSWSYKIQTMNKKYFSIRQPRRERDFSVSHTRHLWNKK